MGGWGGVGGGGWYKQQKTFAHQQIRLKLPSQQTNYTVYRIHYQCSEFSCRLGVAKRQGQFRMDLFIPRLCHQLPRYIAWKPDLGSIAFLYHWDREYGFAIPPFNLTGQVLSKILKEKIDHLIIVTSACIISKNVCRATIFSVSCKKCINKSTGETPSSSRNKATEISDVKGFWKSLQMEEISGNAAKLIAHSRRKSSTASRE